MKIRTKYGTFNNAIDMLELMKKDDLKTIDLEVIHGGTVLLKKLWSIEDVENFIKVRGDII